MEGREREREQKDIESLKNCAKINKMRFNLDKIQGHTLWEKNTNYIMEDAGWKTAIMVICFTFM